MASEVVVVGENRSLGENLAEFLSAHQFNVILVRDVPEAEALRSQGRFSRDAVLVDACSWQRCAAQRMWRSGPLKEHAMVQVGPRQNPEVTADRLYHVTLPLVAEDVVRLFRRLLGFEPGSMVP